MTKSSDAPEPKVTLKLNKDAFDAQLILTTNDGQEIDLGPLLHIHEINLKVKAGHQHSMSIECTSLGDLHIEGDAPIDHETVDHIKRQLDFICPPKKVVKELEHDFPLEYEAQFPKPEIGNLAACLCGRSSKVIAREVTGAFGYRVKLDCVCMNPTFQTWPDPTLPKKRERRVTSLLKDACTYASGEVSFEVGRDHLEDAVKYSMSPCQLPPKRSREEDKAEEELQEVLRVHGEDLMMAPQGFAVICHNCGKNVDTPYKLKRPLCAKCK